MIVDSHLHLGTTMAAPRLDKSMEATLSLMDHMGVDMAIQASSALMHGQLERGYQKCLKDYQESGGRFLSYAYFDPHDPEAHLQSVRACLDEEPFVGIKIHPAKARCFPDDKLWDVIWRCASQRNVPILTHSWWTSSYNPTQQYATPDRFERYVSEYPDVQLILGHAGGRYEGHRAAVALMNAHPNVWVDLSGDLYAFGQVEWFVAQVGAERILFGTDITFLDGRTVLGHILDADISRQEKGLILGENAAHLFRLDSHEKGQLGT